MPKLVELSLLTLLAGCSVQPSMTSKESSPLAATASPRPLSALEAERIVGDAYASFTSGDAIQIMAHYAPGAIVLDAGHNAPSNDRSMITKWTADFALMKPSDLTTSPHMVQVLNGETIISSGIAAFLADVGGRRQRVSVRYTHVFERQRDGRWLIVNEHNSLSPEPVAPGL